MAGNTFGTIFKITTFGESHGLGIGCVLDGLPANFAINLEQIQSELDRRKPGTTNVVSQRKEIDKLQVLSGLFAGKTTGAPLTFFIANLAQKSKDYNDLADKFRPGHADYTYFKKYLNRDHNGGGRASARETVARVVAGAVAKQYLQDYFATKFCCKLVMIHHITAENAKFTNIDLPDNKFNFADSSKVAQLEQLITNIRRERNSVGAKARIVVTNVPQGLGEPVFNKLDAELAKAFMSINAVKSVAIGEGYDCHLTTGYDFNDQIEIDGLASNNAGGVLGGISTGQDLICELTIKPTPSIGITQETITTNGDASNVLVTGRHDPCVAIRAVPIIEAMAAIVLFDLFLWQNARVLERANSSGIT